MSLIKDLPNEEKPREKLLKYGVKNISTADLISIILRCGTKNNSVKELSNNILTNFKDLTDISLNNLINIKGIGKVKAITLISALELGKRVYYTNEKENVIIKNTNDVYNFIKVQILGEKQEKFYAILLDTKNKIISYKLLFIGTINSSITHPREILKYAINELASSIILVHNHPSGDVNPSNEDIDFTNRILKASKIIGINLLDHVIIGDNNYYSFFESNKE